MSQDRSRTPAPPSGPGGPTWRALAAALTAVTAGLDPDDVLQRLADAARGLCGAMHATVRTVDGTTGVPLVHTSGGPCQGPDRALEVALQADGRMTGQVHVCGRPVDAGFTAEDHEALRALVAAAAVAVDKAHLYRAVLRRQRWSDALGRAIHAVVARSEQDARARLAPVPGIARAAGRFELAALAFRTPGRSPAATRWVLHYADWDPGAGTCPCRTAGPVPGGEACGDGCPAGAGCRRLEGLAMPGTAVRRISPREVAHLDARELAWLPGGWSWGLLVPVAPAQDVCDGVLLLTTRAVRVPGRGGFSVELEFGQRLGLAVQVAQAHADADALKLLRDRDRIARDLHDTVIQRLFAVGLSLQAARTGVRMPEVAGRLDRAVNDLDETIKDVRRSIFELHARPGTPSVRERVAEVVDDLAAALPDDCAVHLGEDVETVGEELAADLVAALREMLTNVVKHAGATTVQVYVTVGKTLEAEVVDDGRGPGPGPGPGGHRSPGHGNGLRNLAARAAGRGGRFDLGPGLHGGTVAVWSVPLPPARAGLGTEAG